MSDEPRRIKQVLVMRHDLKMRRGKQTGKNVLLRTSFPDDAAALIEYCKAVRLFRATRLQRCCTSAMVQCRIAAEDHS